MLAVANSVGTNEGQLTTGGLLPVRGEVLATHYHNRWGRYFLGLSLRSGGGSSFSLSDRLTFNSPGEKELPATEIKIIRQIEYAVCDGLGHILNSHTQHKLETEEKTWNVCLKMTDPVPLLVNSTALSFRARLFVLRPGGLVDKQLYFR